MKIKILKKNILKEENCGCSAAPMDMAPNEQLPVAGDVTQMSPEQAFDAGYNAAIEEIMAMVGDMIAGGIPVDMAVPADIANMDQLEE